MTQRSARVISYLSIVLLASGAWAPAGSAAEDAIEGQYLVMLRDEAARGPGDIDSAKPSVREAIESLAVTYRGQTMVTYERAIKGALLEISKEDALALARDPAVALVEQNRFVASPALTGGVIGSCHPAVGSRLTQVLTGGGSQAIDCPELDPREPGYDCQGNWGLDRIDQDALPRDGFYDYELTGDGVHVFIIDTGVNDFPGEFDGRIVRGIWANRTILNPFDPLRDNTFDCIPHGHGTHVTGIIGSTTWGVAKDVTLHPVKFYDFCGCGDEVNPDIDGCDDPDGSGPAPPRRGGTADMVIRALDYIIGRGLTPAVVNMSGANVTTWDGIIAASVQSLLDAGIQFVQAAGNQDDSVACSRTIGDEVPDAIVVGGADVNRVGAAEIDGRWRREGPRTTDGDPDPGYNVWCDPDPPGGPLYDCGSNTGTCIDVWAPASHITSAAKDASGGCRLSGTSMAAPHVTGAAALYLEENPGATPQQVQQAIIDLAVVGVLEDTPGSPYSIGNSPNRLLRVGAAPAADLAVELTQTNSNDKASFAQAAGKAIGGGIIAPPPIDVNATVDNLGPSAGEDVELVVVFGRVHAPGFQALPLGQTVVPLGAAQDCDLVISGPGWEPFPQTYTCDLGTLLAGGSTTLSWRVWRSESPPSPPLQADATVSGSVADPDPANNQDSTVVQ